MLAHSSYPGISRISSNSAARVNRPPYAGTAATTHDTYRQYPTLHTEIMNIDVQPPNQVQAGSTLYPPLVVTSDSSADYDFLQVMALDAHGRVLDGVLHGTLSTARQALDDNAGGGASSYSSLEYAVFPDLAFRYSGSYYLRVSAVRIDYSQPEPEAVVVTSLCTREVLAWEVPVAVEVPSSQEKSLLRRLRRHGGFGVPRPPTR
ncbi:uncharacterized protein BCR38DRAFT_488995 [Pseudomassariella vexata]|uniref:Velvet domain-containing protein n=1 Tax=Pseudomassariella vexata TaxID=1141098 RepID=A0A1Y2DJB9_9PEZI|nr:uncharacterized protein BCR38DRAFT_488995 [Pseudomassariella vexata]ORY59266.1 hypothetical protein BCR38DRAFT_488995 [Pseudomassariella vexata]